MISPKATDAMSAVGIADHLGVAERTVRRWVAAGALPAERRGRALVISLRDAEQLRPPVRRTPSAGAELRGRYLELLERVRDLEVALAEERRRTGRLEARLEQHAA